MSTLIYDSTLKSEKHKAGFRSLHVGKVDVSHSTQVTVTRGRHLVHGSDDAWMICGSKGVREGNQGLFYVFVCSEEMYHSFPVEHALLEGYLCRGMAFSEPDTCFQVFVFSSESYHRFHSFSFISSSTRTASSCQINQTTTGVSCRVDLCHMYGASGFETREIWYG